MYIENLTFDNSIRDVETRGTHHCNFLNTNKVCNVLLLNLIKQKTQFLVN